MLASPRFRSDESPRLLPHPKVPQAHHGIQAAEVFRLTLLRSLFFIKNLRTPGLRLLVAWCAFVCLAVACPPRSRAWAQQQQSNPVERKVLNPITDTPNVNPLQQEQPIRPRMPVRPDATTPAAAA